MTVHRLVAAGLAVGAAAAFVAALLRPRREAGYDPVAAVGAQPAASW